MCELAVSALSMLSTRPDGRDRLRRCGSIASMVHAFKPAMGDPILEHLGSALGNLGNHATARQQMKDAGMVGMVTRVLRLNSRPRAQASHPMPFMALSPLYRPCLNRHCCCFAFHGIIMSGILDADSCSCGTGPFISQRPRDPGLCTPSDSHSPSCRDGCMLLCPCCRGCEADIACTEAPQHPKRR